MTGKRSVKRVIQLLPEDWERLGQLAGQLGCLNVRGSRPGQPSVAALMRDLARGRVHARRSGQGQVRPAGSAEGQPDYAGQMQEDSLRQSSVVDDEVKAEINQAGKES
jgi:hypothetical protein